MGVRIPMRTQTDCVLPLSLLCTESGGAPAAVEPGQHCTRVTRMMSKMSRMSRMPAAPTPIPNANDVGDTSKEASELEGGAFTAVPGLLDAGVTDKTEMDKPALARMDA